MGSITPPYDGNGVSDGHPLDGINGSKTYTKGRLDDGARLRISGIGVEYPPFQFDAQGLETLARRFYPSSPA